MQIVNVFLCRSTRRSIFSTGVLGNRLILSGVILEIMLILLINYTSLGNLLLGTAPIAMITWLFIVPFAAGMLHFGRSAQPNDLIKRMLTVRAIRKETAC